MNMHHIQIENAYHVASKFKKQSRIKILLEHDKLITSNKLFAIELLEPYELQLRRRCVKWETNLSTYYTGTVNCPTMIERWFIDS